MRTNTNSSNNNRLSNDPPPSTGGFGGLFVNGIPKLKATGLPIGECQFEWRKFFHVQEHRNLRSLVCFTGQAYQQYRNENDAPKSNSSVNSRLSNNNVRESFVGFKFPLMLPENYRRLLFVMQVHNANKNNSNDSNSGYLHHHSTSSLTKVRGPPPQPPGPPPKLTNVRVRIFFVVKNS